MAIRADRGTGDSAQAPRPSATVVLVRDAKCAPEVLLVHRRSGPAFGASYVFPGGLLEGEDCRAAAFSDALSPDAASRCLGLAAGGLDYYCAAIRELFEETGVLLARPRNEAAMPSAEALEHVRALLNEGRVAWSDFLGRNELALAGDALHYFAWWITPRARALRFSTRFFLAALPDGQEASADGRELTDSRWMTAADAIDVCAKGDITLPPPTLATLRDISGLGNLCSLLDWARQRAEAGVPRILPAIVRRDGRDRVLMPGDPEYPPDADRGET